MGWTHSWQRRTELSKDGFARAAKDCSVLLGAVGLPLGGFDGSGTPTFNPETILFNGMAPACVEPFEIHQTEFDRHGRELVRGYCKTNRAPYDICVQLALIILKHHLGEEISVFSDGRNDDWSAARDRCQQLLGYGNEFRLSQES